MKLLTLTNGLTAELTPMDGGYRVVLLRGKQYVRESWTQGKPKDAIEEAMLLAKEEGKKHDARVLA